MVQPRLRAVAAIPWRHPLVLLIASGLALTAVYALLITRPLLLGQQTPSASLDLAVRLGGGWAAAGYFTGAMLSLAALYMLALTAVARLDRRQLGPAMALSVLMVASLLPAHPFDSADVLHYAASARLFTVHGQNPLTTPPDAVPGDPVAALADWGDLPSPYGPLWALASGAPRPFLGDNASAASEIVALKTIAGLALLGTALLVAATAEHLRPGSRTLAFVMTGWNPLFLLHAAGDAHNDAVMLLCVALAVWLVTRDRPVLAGGALTLAALIKFVPLVLFPALLVWLLRSGRPHRLRELAGIVGLSAALVVLAYVPFWQGTRTLAASLDEGGYLTTSVHAALVPALLPLMSRERADVLLPLIGRLVFGALALHAAWRVGRNADALVRTWAETLLWYVAAGAAWLMPWYVLWALVPVSVLPRRDARLRLTLALCLGALLQPLAPDYLVRIARQGEAWEPVHGIAAALMFLPALALLGWEQVRSRHRKALVALAPCGKVDAKAAGWRDADDGDTGSAGRAGVGDQLHGTGAGARPRIHGESREG